MKKKTRKQSPRKLPSSFVWGGVYDGVKLCDTRKLPKLPRLPSCEITTFLMACCIAQLGYMVVYYLLCGLKNIKRTVL